MAFGNPPIIKFPRVRPPALKVSMRERIRRSSQGIRGPPISTWSTPSCLTRRMPAGSSPPADRLPPPPSRQILGVSGPSARGLGIAAPRVTGVDRAITPAACMIFLRDKSWFMVFRLKIITGGRSPENRPFAIVWRYTLDTLPQENCMSYGLKIREQAALDFV